MVSLTYLRVLIELSNDKFRANVDQMGRFERRLSEHLVGANSTQAHGGVKQGDQGAWEDKDARRERKKREGLERAAAAAATAAAERARKAEEEQEEPTLMES